MRPRISTRGSVRPSVRRSVRPSVRPSVRRSVRNQLFSKSENEGFSSWILSGKPRNIIEMSNCISIGNYACWSVRLSILKVEKTVERTHLLVDQTCFYEIVASFTFFIIIAYACLTKNGSRLNFKCCHECIYLFYMSASSKKFYS